MKTYILLIKNNNKNNNKNKDRLTKAFEKFLLNERILSSI